MLSTNIEKEKEGGREGRKKGRKEIKKERVREMYSHTAKSKTINKKIKVFRVSLNLRNQASGKILYT